MDKMFKIRCQNDNSELYVKPGTTLLDIIKQLHLKRDRDFIGAYVNNKSKDLNFPIYDNKNVNFIDATHFEGARIYQRTLLFILFKAVKDIVPDGEIRVLNSLSRGVYFEIYGTTEKPDAHIIKERMLELVEADIPIIHQNLYFQDVKDIFTKQRNMDKLRLFNSSPFLYYTINQLAELCGDFYGPLAPSTNYIKVFDVIKYYDGYCLIPPTRKNPSLIDAVDSSEKHYNVVLQHKHFIDILGVPDVGSLNNACIEGNSGELIKIGEALQEKNFSILADKIEAKCRKGVKIILISGPSSSGKTTFSNRLTIQLKIFGLKPQILSMDNYFVNRDHTPLDESGKHNFEAIEALDLDLFNDHLAKLTSGEEVEIPKFDFNVGTRYWDGTKIKLGDNGVLIIEGIHSLNPELTSEVPDSLKYKVYVSALSTISLDNLTRISTTDNRLLRRIIRDSKYRNHTALQTLNRWGSVRRGEEQNIFPYQNQADTMFNTALFFELSVLKQHAEPLLLSVPDTVEEYSEAQRLLKILSYFKPIEEKELPPTSILREFIGGSSFSY